MTDFETGERVYTMGKDRVLRWNVVNPIPTNGLIIVRGGGTEASIPITSIFKCREDVEAAISARQK